MKSFVWPQYLVEPQHIEGDGERIGQSNAYNSFRHINENSRQCKILFNALPLKIMRFRSEHYFCANCPDQLSLNVGQPAQSNLFRKL
jgi:hypothetical protein